MNQSTLIVGAVMVAFIAYVAINQRLGVYRNIVLGGGGGSGSGSGSGGASGAATLNPLSPNFNPMGVGQAAGGALRQWLGIGGGGSGSAGSGGPGQGNSIPQANPGGGGGE